ncbi:MAG: hypothetical protein LBR49_05305 [Tannerella sp.]|nr:hypothetical protein [Tannerella sp.]
MKEKEISDNEIQVLGTSRKSLTGTSAHNPRRRLSAVLIIAVICCAVAVMAFFLWKMFIKRHEFMYETVSLRSEPAVLDTDTMVQRRALPVGYVEAFADTVNDVPLIVYVPKNAVPELLVGAPDENDRTIVFAAWAADLGGNNYGIVGDFVYLGEPMGHGGRKEGYCAIIGSKLTIGIGYKTPLYQQSIDEKGYFFRQYPLVKNGEPIENKPRGKAIRRALAIKEGTVMMFESSQRESFHDFACALSDYGVSEAIYLVGSTAYGWYRDNEGQVTTFGAKDDREWQDINYLVWR